MKQREYRVYSLMRSGQHAVINWMQHCLAERNIPSLLLNDLERLLEKNPGALDQKWQDIVFVNVEDRTLDAARELFTHPKFGRRPVTELVVLRDPWTLFASRHFYQNELHLPLEDALECWKDHARAEIPIILFNRWFSEPHYRLEWAERLGLPPSHAGIDDVSHLGAGSSFDGRRYHGRAQQMGVLSRHRALSPHWYWERFDAELHNLAKEKHGFDPGEGY